MTAIEPNLAGLVDADPEPAGPDDWSAPGDHAPAVFRLVVEVDGIPMSALVCRARRPRAVIVALHGGSAMSAYFDDPDRPRLSLLRTGAALGFTVIALDRPGYGASSAYAAEVAEPERRVDLVYAAVDRLLADSPRGAGLFLLGHSIGCPLVVRMAADGERGAGLLGIEIAGTGLQHHPYLLDLMEGNRSAASWERKPGRGLYDLLWEPVHLYPPAAVGGASFTSRSPGYEREVEDDWPVDFPHLAARVRVPVRYSLGDHERVWPSSPAALAEVAGLFTAAPRVDVDEMAASGHNLSVGVTAFAYHLKVLSFVEECVLARLRPRDSPDP